MDKMREEFELWLQEYTPAQAGGLDKFDAWEAAWHRSRQERGEAVAWGGTDHIELLAMELAAEEHDDIHQMCWEGYPPEPWGEVWMKYIGEARGMIERVTAIAHPPASQVGAGVAVSIPEPNDRQLFNIAFNLSAEFGPEFTESNKAFAMAVMREYRHACPVIAHPPADDARVEELESDMRTALSLIDAGLYAKAIAVLGGVGGAVRDERIAELEATIAGMVENFQRLQSEKEYCCCGECTTLTPSTVAEREELRHRIAALEAQLAESKEAAAQYRHEGLRILDDLSECQSARDKAVQQLAESREREGRMREAVQRIRAIDNGEAYIIASEAIGAAP